MEELKLLLEQVMQADKILLVYGNSSDFLSHRCAVKTYFMESYLSCFLRNFVDANKNTKILYS